MDELLQQLDRWRLRPSAIVTDEFRLEDADLAYQAADRGSTGKVVITFA